MEKTKEIVVDFRREHTQHAPLTINGATVERVSNTKLLDVHVKKASPGPKITRLSKKAQQHLYFFRTPRRARCPVPIMCTFYGGTIENILNSCIMMWYATTLCPATRSSNVPSNDNIYTAIPPLDPKILHSHMQTLDSAAAPAIL